MPRIALADGWTLWGTCMVRGTGFSAALALALASRPGEAVDDDAAIATGLAAERAALRAAAGTPAFREAVTWQNRHAAATGLAPYLAEPDRHDARARKRERMALAYLLRYCARNETIGFFGPVGWGRLDPACGEFLEARPGAGLLAARTTYLEPWGLAALVARWLAEPAFAARVPLVLHPLAWVEGGRLHGVPGARALDGAWPLAPGEEPLLLAPPRPRAALEAEAPEGWVGRAVARGWLVPDLAAAWEAKPLEGLRRRLAEIGGGGGAAPGPGAGLASGSGPRLDAAALDPLAAAAADLDAIERHRRRVQAAAGAPDTLDAALAGLEAAFTALTGEAPRRHAGEAYAGRTLAYEDARRDLALVAGAPLLARLREPLALVLRAGRWHVWRATMRLDADLARLHEGLLRRRGEGYGAPYLWEEARALFAGEDPLGLGALRAEAAGRWAEALGLEAGGGRALRASAAHREAVARAFPSLASGAAPHPSRARHHGVDLVVGRSAGGEDLLVLGELHPGVHPFATLTARAQHPRPSELDAAFRADRRVPGVQVARPDAFCRSAHDDRLDPDALQVLVDPGVAAWRPRRIRLGDLVVRSGPGGPWLHPPAPAPWGPPAPLPQGFPAARLFDRTLRVGAAAAFGLTPEAPRWPRVTLDGLVVGRETWRVPAASLAPLLRVRGPGPAQHRALRAWGDGIGLPERVFVRCPEEPKPMLYDRGSVLGGSLFAALARRATWLTLTEMLPDLAEARLPGPDGALHAAELRLVAVDPLQHEAPGG